MKNDIISVLVVTALALVIFPKVLNLVKGMRERFDGGGVVKDVPGTKIEDLKTMIKTAYKTQYGMFPTEKVLGEIIANNYPDNAGQVSSAPVNLAVNSGLSKANPASVAGTASPVVAGALPAGALPAGAGALPAGAGALSAGALPAGAGALPAGASVASSAGSAAASPAMSSTNSADNNLAAATALAQNDRLNIEELLKPRTSKAGDVTRSGNAINYSNNPELKSREGDIPIVGGSLLTSKGAAAATAIGGLNNKTPSPNLNIYPNITFIYAPSLEGRRSLPSQRPIKKRKERDYANYVQQQNTLGPSIVNSMGPPSSRPKGNGMTQFPPAMVKDFNSVWSGLK
jgi:hypothetical protein